MNATNPTYMVRLPPATESQLRNFLQKGLPQLKPLSEADADASKVEPPAADQVGSQNP